jgi:hypothetical protein
MPAGAPIFRAPMRARDRDAPRGAGADFGVRHGVVGIGDAVPSIPADVGSAVAAAIDARGDKAGRMLRQFADLPGGTFVWTRAADDRYFLGRICGPWRYDDSPAARAVGIHHVRSTDWLDRPFSGDEVPVAVTETFHRGGRNLQRTRDERAERETAELWAAERSSRAVPD